MWSKSYCLLVVLALFWSPASAHDPATPAGLWQTIKPESGKATALVRISEQAGVWNAVIVDLLDPLIAKNARCKLCTGENKDAAIIGLTLMWGLRASTDAGDLWVGGKILEPYEGKIYDVQVKLQGKTLMVRGYLGTPFFGKTQHWLRME